MTLETWPDCKRMSTKVATNATTSFPFWNRVFPWLLALSGTVVYANSLDGAFVFDDHQEILGNHSIRQLWPLSTLLAVDRRPVTHMSLAINYALGHYRKTDYHVGNLVIHIAAALLLYGLLRRTLALVRQSIDQTTVIPHKPPTADSLSTSAPTAFVIALFWLLQPLQTQAVTYIYQRTESLAALFYLLVLYALNRTHAGRHPLAWGLAAVVACGLGMGTKETMVTAPIVALLYDRVFLAGSFRQAIKQRCWLHLGLMATWAVLVAVLGVDGAFREKGWAAGFSLPTISPLQYAANQPGVLMHYLRLTLWPAPLCFDYAWPPASTFAQMILPWLATSILLWATLWAFFRRPPVGFLGAAFFFILAPTSTLMPIHHLAVEYRLYLPQAVILAALVFLGQQLIQRLQVRRTRYIWALVALITLVLGYRTVHRNREYLSEEILWENTLTTAPHNARAHYNLGWLLRKQGKTPRAIHHLQRAVALQADFYQAYHNLGLIWATEGNLNEAVRHYRRALKIAPDNTKPLFNLAVVFAQQGRFDQAITHASRVVELEPDHALAHRLLGDILSEQKNFHQALYHYRRAVDIDPKDVVAHHNLGQTFRHLNRPAQAHFHFQQAQILQLKSNSRDSSETGQR